MTRAFTLIEVILALAITVIIGVILAAALSATSKASRSAETALNQFRQTMTTADLLQAELENAVPPSASTTTTPLQGPFTGTSDDIIFYAFGPEPKATVQGDVHQVEYTAVASTGNQQGQNLVRRVASNLLAQTINTPPDQVVCQDVDSIEFSYYDGTTWQDTWDSTQMNNSLPMAIRFTLNLLPEKQGQPDRTTTRIVPLSCFNPANSTATSTTGGN